MSPVSLRVEAELFIAQLSDHRASACNGGYDTASSDEYIDRHRRISGHQLAQHYILSQLFAIIISVARSPLIILYLVASADYLRHSQFVARHDLTISRHPLVLRLSSPDRVGSDSRSFLSLVG